jgi:hypothetical protein
VPGGGELNELDELSEPFSVSTPGGDGTDELPSLPATSSNRPSGVG